MNENDNAASFSFMDAQLDFAQPELLSGKELMCLLPIVVELAEKTAAPFFAQFLGPTCISKHALRKSSSDATRFIAIPYNLAT